MKPNFELNTFRKNNRKITCFSKSSPQKKTKNTFQIFTTENSNGQNNSYIGVHKVNTANEITFGRAKQLRHDIVTGSVPANIGDIIENVRDVDETKSVSGIRVFVYINLAN